MFKRNYYINIWNELSNEKSLIFLIGPRQSGKTTLSKIIANDFNNNIYFNWDIIKHRNKFVNDNYFFENIVRTDKSNPLIILDEFHKFKNWKQYLKGVYDNFANEYKFLVTGSGRLNLNEKTGESLAGRYFRFTLFPLTISEFFIKRDINDFLSNPLEHFDINNENETKNIWDQLFIFGGFPEPFFRAKKTFLNKWINTFSKNIIREDISIITNIKRISDIDVLYSMLSFKIGSPISRNSIARDIGASFVSIDNWLKIMEAFYLIFSISPYYKSISRSIRKEKKIYLFNYAEINDNGKKFENMIGLELLRFIYSQNEKGIGNFKLNYLRNKEKEEVDFLITLDDKPKLLIEAKFNDTSLSPSIFKFQNILKIPAIQLVNKNDIYKIKKGNSNNILTVSAHKWLSSLP